MPSIDEAKQQQIAQWLSASKTPTFSYKGYATSKKYVRGIEDALAALADTKKDAALKKVADKFLNDVLLANGFGALISAGTLSNVQAGRLVLLIAAGAISTEEAQGFLTTSYGLVASEIGLSFAFIPLTAAQKKQAEAEQVVGQVKLPDTGGAEQLIDIASQARAQAGAGSVVQRSLLDTLDVPDGASGEEISLSLRTLTAQVQLELAKISTGDGLNLRENSIDGRVLVPNSVPATALNIGDLAREYQGLPGPEEAIELTLAPDASLDRWLSTTVSSKLHVGPGRVWRVQSVRYPPGFRPALGVMRYRLIAPGMRFTPLSVRVLDDVKSGYLTQQPARFEIQYGCVITGIPNNLSGNTRRLLRLDYVGETVGAIDGNNINISAQLLNSPTNLFEPLANEVFVQAPRTVFDSFYESALASGARQFFNPEWNSSSSSVPYLKQIRGFGVQVLGAPNVEALYPALNGRESLNIAHIGGRALGSSGTIPEGLSMEPPAGAGVGVRVAGTNTQIRPRFAAGYNAATYPSYTLLGSAEHVIDGVPFLLQDVLGLRNQRDTFTAVVQVLPARIFPSVEAANALATSGVGPEFYPATWPSNGLEIAPSNGREFRVDMLVV